MSDPFMIAKIAGQLVGTVGVTKVVGDIIRNNVTIVTRMDSARVTVGSFVISSIAMDYTARHVSEYVDRAYAWHLKKKIEVNVIDKPNEEEVSSQD